MNHDNLPENEVVAVQIVTAQAENEKVRLNRGAIGVIFGSKDHVPNNVAAIIAVLALGFMILIWALSPDFGKAKDAISIASSILTLALGYLFGRASKE